MQIFCNTFLVIFYTIHSIRKVITQFEHKAFVVVSFTILDLYSYRFHKNDVMRLGERPRSLEGKPNINKPKLHVYTPWFSYQINMTLIECSRIRKDKPFVTEATRAAMTARSSFNIRVSVAS